MSKIKFNRGRYLKTEGIMVLFIISFILVLTPVTVFAVLKATGLVAVAQTPVDCAQVQLTDIKADSQKSETVKSQLSAVTSQIRDRDKNTSDNLNNRKKALIEAMQTDPNTALANILPGDKLKKLQTFAPKCIERELEIVGTLEVFHTDYFKENRSTTEYTLVDKSGGRTKLHFANNLHLPVESRTKVKIRGAKIDDQMVLDGAKSLSQTTGIGGGIDVVSQPGNPPVTGVQRTAIVSAVFVNSPTTETGITKSQMDTVMALTDKFYRENSYDKVSLSTQSFGPYR